ncbi:MAG: hypothetical protein KGL37_12445 [Acidobacteriota bacterium]|nr:hypothetical protein [Acidobacteriota bacterium]
MKRFCILVLFLFTAACVLQAQAVDTTVCDVLSNPKSFDGKIVRIKGTVAAGFDQFMIKGGNCGQHVNGIWLSYPQGSKGKAGPVAVVELQPARNFSGKFQPEQRQAIKLVKDKSFKQFDSLLSQPHQKGVGLCLGCTRYEVTATLVGRLDGVEDASLRRDASGKIIGFGGFGNLNAFPARLVLQSVSDVTPKEVDFSKSDEVSKGQMKLFTGNGDLYDPVVAAHRSIARLGGSPAGIQAEKDVAQFGKPGEHNGVSIGYGATNEASVKEDGQGTHDSPDGVLFNCTFNLDRLEGDGQVRAIVHAGQHVADLRDPQKGNENAGLYILEYNAWAITAATAVANGDKFLTLPGGYLLWSSAWPNADRTKNVDDAINGFLSQEMLLSK